MEFSHGLERLRINIIETKSWLFSYINMLPYCVKRKLLKQNAFQIGTFGREVTTRPPWRPINHSRLHRGNDGHGAFFNSIR